MTNLVPPDSTLQSIHDLLASRFVGTRPRIYEAGGGSMTRIPPNLLERSTIAVVDIDETQLKANRYAHTKILGDIQTYSFPPDSFDLVVCYDVLEHLEAPDQAIWNFHRALAPGGLLLIGAPDPGSFSGWVTRWTPHWFHVWYYRAILRRENAGQPGHPPFRVVYHPIVAPQALIEFCKGLGFELVLFNQYESPRYREMLETRPMLGWLLYAATGLMNGLASGHRNFRKGDYHIAFKKGVTSAAE